MRRVALLSALSLTFLALASPPAVLAVVINNPWIVNDRVADTHNITTMATTYINAYTPDGVIAPASNDAKAINLYNNQKRRLYHWADEPPSDRRRHQRPDLQPERLRLGPVRAALGPGHYDRHRGGLYHPPHGHQQPVRPLGLPADV